jgi:hypothetical protein
MTVIEIINGWNIGNLCGQYYVEKNGKRIGPFSSSADAVKFAQSSN